MAYAIENFTCTRGTPSSPASILNRTNHFYYSNVDDLATIMTPGYFPVNFGFPMAFIFTHDTLRIKGTDGYVDVTISDDAIPIITPLPASNPFDQDLNTTNDVNFNSVTLLTNGATPDQLDFYTKSEPVILTATTYPFASAPMITCTVSRVGNILTLYVPQITDTITTQAFIGFPIPAWIGSLNAITDIKYGTEGALATNIDVEINNSFLSFYKFTSGRFTPFDQVGQNLTIEAFCISYLTA